MYNPEMFFNPYRISPRITLEIYKDGLWYDIKKLDKPGNVSSVEEPIVKLRTMSKYPLEECLFELKFGRTDKDQRMIDMFVDQLRYPRQDGIVVKEEETFLDRLNYEKSELVDRHNKLVDFLKTEKYASLPEKQRELLRQQNTIMQDYIDILTDRIALLN